MLKSHCPECVGCESQNSPLTVLSMWGWLLMNSWCSAVSTKCRCAERCGGAHSVAPPPLLDFSPRLSLLGCGAASSSEPRSSSACQGDLSCHHRRAVRSAPHCVLCCSVSPACLSCMLHLLLLALACRLEAGMMMELEGTWIECDPAGLRTEKLKPETCPSTTASLFTKLELDSKACVFSSSFS